jgi:translation initiation factor IF-3
VGFRRRRWRDVRPEEDKIRVNRHIRVPEVRVINEDGQQLGIMATEAARDIAVRVGLDLVEVAPSAQPPVCKIMDYGRYKYELKKKASSARKAQHRSQVKEIKLRPRIAEHDLDFKMKRARQFLIDGDKVRCTVWFRGREIVHSEQGFKVLAQVAERLADVAKVEQQAKFENRQLALILTPDRGAIEKMKQQEQKAAESEETPQAEESDQAVESGEEKGAEA